MHNWLQIFQQSLKSVNAASSGMHQTLSKISDGLKKPQPFNLKPPTEKDVEKDFGMQQIKQLAESKEPNSPDIETDKDILDLFNENKIKKSVEQNEFENLEKELDLTDANKIIDSIDFDFEIPDDIKID